MEIIILNLINHSLENYLINLYNQNFDNSHFINQFQIIIIMLNEVLPYLGMFDDSQTLYLNSIIQFISLVINYVNSTFIF